MNLQICEPSGVQELFCPRFGSSVGSKQPFLFALPIQLVSFIGNGYFVSPRQGFVTNARVFAVLFFLRDALAGRYPLLALPYVMEPSLCRRGAAEPQPVPLPTLPLEMAPGGTPDRAAGERGAGGGPRTPVSCLRLLSAAALRAHPGGTACSRAAPRAGRKGSRRGLSGGPGRPGPRSRLAAAPHRGGGWRGGRCPYARSRAPAAPAPARYSSRGYAGCRRPDYKSTRFWGSLARRPAPAWLSKQ